MRFSLVEALLGVASLVLGILGLLMAFFWPVISAIGILFGILAIVLGIVGRKQAVTSAQPTGLATAGMVLGVVATCIGVLTWVLCAMCVSSVKSSFEQMAKERTGVPLDRNVVRVTPKELLAAYQENEVAADNRYRKKTVELSGRVSAISKDVFDNPFVSVDAGEGRTVNVYFDAESAKKVADLKNGQTVTVVGRVDGFMLTSVTVKDSQLK